MIAVGSTPMTAIVRLGNCCSIQNGYPFKSEFYNEQFGTPLIRVRSLKEQNCDIYYSGPFDESYLVNNGDILIGMDGDFQPCYWQGEKALLNQRVCRLMNFTDTVDPYYIYQALKKPLKDIENAIHFTTVKHLSSFTIQEIPILLPPLFEQCTIAHVLQTVQQAIQLRRKELELEREHKTALMQHLFTYGTLNEPTKQSEVGEIPKSWEVVKLEKILDKQNKYSIVDGPFGSSIKQTDYLNAGVPIIRIRNISKAGRFIDGNFLYISEAKYRELSRSAVLPFDILVSIKGTIGNVCIYLGTHDKILLSTTGVCKISVSKKDVDVRYVYYYMTTPSYQRQLEADSAASVQKCISLRTLKTSKIPLPPLSEQSQIATILCSCDAKISSIEKEITLHEELFRTLLDELMTGRISTLPLVEQLEKGILTHGQRTPDGTGTTD